MIVAGIRSSGGNGVNTSEELSLSVAVAATVNFRAVALLLDKIDVENVGRALGEEE